MQKTYCDQVLILKIQNIIAYFPSAKKHNLHHFEIVYLLSLKGYAIFKLHKTGNKQIAEHFQFHIGDLFHLHELG